MRLFCSASSPYVRKVFVLAHETGQIDELERIDTDVWSGGEPFLAVNPLGKVPALVLEDGMSLIDSYAICDFLDARHRGPRRIPETGADRWTVLHWHAVAQGVIDALLARRWELRFREDNMRSTYWMDRQSAAIERGLDAWERRQPSPDAPFTFDLITLACALAYFDVRIKEVGLAHGWRRPRPALSRWFDAISQRPSMMASALAA
jgi:glutathione S-transferase